MLVPGWWYPFCGHSKLFPGSIIWRKNHLRHRNQQFHGMRWQRHFPNMSHKNSFWSLPRIPRLDIFILMFLRRWIKHLWWSASGNSSLNAFDKACSPSVLNAFSCPVCGLLNLDTCKSARFCFDEQARVQGKQEAYQVSRCRSWLVYTLLELHWNLPY